MGKLFLDFIELLPKSFGRTKLGGTLKKNSFLYFNYMHMSDTEGPMLKKLGVTDKVGRNRGLSFISVGTPTYRQPQKN